MSKAAKRKVQPTDTAMTIEQLATKITEDVEQMSPDEKAKLRALLNREFGPSSAATKLKGFAEAARSCAAEEAAMANCDRDGKPVNRSPER
jgi:hypothetical protein